MTAPEAGQLIVKGRILSRTGEPRFRRGTFEFLQMQYDDTNDTQRLPETVPFELAPDGSFRVVLYPATNGAAWIARLKLQDFDGRLFVDKRTLPPHGEVDYFRCPRAVEDTDDVHWPERETPILVSDFGKPGGPLQLTDQGTIPEDAFPNMFLRVDDERLPELQLWNYLTRDEYEKDQNTVREYPFGPSLLWEASYDMDYRPVVECVQSDGTVIHGAVSYPVGTKKVLVEWDAPTSGVLILR